MVSKRPPLILMLFLAVAVSGTKCQKKDCDRLASAKLAACALHPESEACQTATKLFEDGCSPEATPTPPVVEPPKADPKPDPLEPPAEPPVEPTPEPSPVSACPKELEEGAEVWVRAKAYGQGIDSEVNVYGDPLFCKMIHGIGRPNCHLEGWHKRLECEMELLGKYVNKKQACPIWKYKVGDEWMVCKQAPHKIVSCDHWGNTAYRDDPMTPEVFEGEPGVCAQQRDANNDPNAGFFIIAHGAAQVIACRPDGKGCSREAVEVDH